MKQLKIAVFRKKKRGENEERNFNTKKSQRRPQNHVNPFGAILHLGSMTAVFEGITWKSSISG